MHPFMNPDEGRLRAGWRLAAQLFLMFLVGSILLLLLAAILPASVHRLYPIAMGAGAALSIWAAARGLDIRPWQAYGIRLNRDIIVEYAIGFGIAGSAIAIIFSVEYAAGWLSVTGFGWDGPQHHSIILSLIWYFLWMCVVGFYEESVFRGYQIVNLSEGLNFKQIGRPRAAAGAVVLSSLIFGALHALNPDASCISTLNVALAGGMLAFPFIITGRLGLSIGTHIGWNFFQGAVFGFPVSGLNDRTSLLHIQQHGSPLITGGGFGPEGGLWGLAGIILVAGATTVYLRRNDRPLSIHPKFGIYRPSTRYKGNENDLR